jgi:hypothetical protein
MCEVVRRPRVTFLKRSGCINSLTRWTQPLSIGIFKQKCLTTADWKGITQNFVATFLFESQYPTVDQALQVVRQRIFEEAPTHPVEQEEDEWTAPLQKL